MSMRYLAAALLLTGCGALSTHQSPRLLDHRETAFLGGLGGGAMDHCQDDTGQVEYGNGCVLAADPFFGMRYGWHPLEADSTGGQGRWPMEVGIKASGVPFIGGTILVDFRVQPVQGPFQASYDFGLSAYPCITSGYEGNDNVDCHGNPFGFGLYAGATVGWDWLHAGAKYWANANTWDGWQMLPGATVGGAWGPKRFKLMPSVDAYFYQWPFDLTPELRLVYGLGARFSY